VCEIVFSMVKRTLSNTCVRYISTVNYSTLSLAYRLALEGGVVRKSSIFVITKDFVFRTTSYFNDALCRYRIGIHRKRSLHRR
jgi:hypothetical protein